jgi:hypothetical protein
MLSSILRGHFTKDEVSGYRDAVRSDPAYRPGLPALIDCRQTSTLLSTADLRALAEELKRPAPTASRPWRYAVLVSSDVAFGLARMFEAFVRDAPIDIRPFWDREEAVTWLRSEEATP